MRVDSFLCLPHAQPSLTLPLSLCSSHAQATTFGRKMSVVAVNKGDTLPFYVAPLTNDKYGKNGTVGQYLTGTMTLAKVRSRLQ